MQKKFLKIKSALDEFHNQMLSKGRLMLKDTNIGYWGISPSTELFELFQKTNLEKHKRFLDLGSGDGRAVFIAGLFTDATGIEYDEELHNFATTLGSKIKSDGKLLNQDYMQHSLTPYDYIFIHPDKKISVHLEDKLIAEMKKDSKLVVFGPHYHPERMNKINTLDVEGTLISVFQKQ